MLRLLDEAQARQLPALIAEWSRTPGDRAWIARALRIDLALLTERPELAVPCVYRRCAFVGGEHEQGFYAQRAELPDLSSLRETMQRWAEAQRGPWLRAMRPPPVPVDGAVVEEYRTSLRGTLWTSDDGERIGVVGEATHVVWDRATGRRVDVARPTLPVSTYWTMARENTWGHCVIEHDGRRVELAVESDETVRRARALSDELVFVWGDDVEDDDFYGVIDTRAQRLLWRERGACSSIIPIDHERVLVGHRGGLTTMKLATGEQLERWRCPLVGELRALPDSHIASRYGDVIYVWNVGEAIERPQVVHPRSKSWIAAEFSPDGRRLVTGQLLCDAVTGRFISHIECNGPGWLEGGPPRRCQRLCNGVFVEITPFGLTVWDSHDGKQLLVDRDRRARLSDTVAFDPNGQYHAIWSDRGSLFLYRLMQGELVRELEQPLANRWDDRKLGFSADGSLLAWENANGERFALAMSAPLEVHRIDEAPWEPAPREITIADGLLVVDDVTIPCDDHSAIASHDGRQLAGPRSHYFFERSRQ